MQHFYLLMSVDKESNIKTLNNVAVEYFALGMQNVSYQIWDELYHEIQCNAPDYEKFLPVISCNMGNMLRQTGYYEEAYHVLVQGLRRCFDTGSIYALPELLMQLSLIKVCLNNTQKADSMYSFSKHILQWSRHADTGQSIEDLMEQDFLLYCEDIK